MERRNHQRYGVHPGTFAVLRSTSIGLSKIKDMSMGEIANNLFKMDILFARDAFYLDRLLFKPIFDIEIDTDIPLNSFTIRKCGVQFGELNQQQRSQLEYFICNYTLNPVGFDPTIKPWNDERMVICKSNEMVESII